jgi:predicted NACHT family NTPase
MKWIRDQSAAERFLVELSKSPYADTAMKPLLLAHLCAIYERIGAIPEQPKVVYRKIVALLLEEWDQERG